MPPRRPQQHEDDGAAANQYLWIGVSRDLLITSGFLVWAFDEDAFLEPCAVADQRDQMGCVEREDVGTADFVTTINVLRRIVANGGGNSDLP